MKARIIFGNKPLQDLVDQYEQSHQHPVNRAFHTLGIPMIVGSIPLFLLAPLIRGFWKLPFSLFTAGWILQFAGHAVEGKPPEFFKDWRFLFVGLRWWLSKIQRVVADTASHYFRVTRLISSKPFSPAASKPKPM